MKIPLELLSEIIKFLPLNLKWDVIRISKYFDIFVLKLQRNWIVNIKFVFIIIIFTFKLIF